MEPGSSFKSFRDLSLKPKKVTGKFAGEKVLIPRIPLFPSEEELGFTFRRLQFPIKVCFSLSINKSQGQTLKRIGLYVKNPVFSHGQLYVGMSRVGCRNDFFVLPQEEDLITNVVYKEVLSSINLCI